MQFSRGDPSQGYYRSGSMGEPVMAGSNVFSADSNTTGTWTPTILYLFVLVLVEMFVFAVLARHV